MANKQAVEVKAGTAWVQDLGTYLLSTEIAPLINQLRKSTLKPEVAAMNAEELKAHYGTDKPTDEQIMADMDIDLSAVGELAFKVVPIGVIEPQIFVGFLNEEQELGPVLKWKVSDEVVSVDDTRVLMDAIMKASGLDKDAGSSFRSSLCHTAE